MAETNILPLSIVQKIEEIGISQDSVIFCQNNRWVYRTGQPIAENKPLNIQPLDSLGPFGN